MEVETALLCSYPILGFGKEFDMGDILNVQKYPLCIRQFDRCFPMDPRRQSQKQVALFRISGPHFRPTVEASIVLQMHDDKLLTRCEHRAPLVRKAASIG